MGGTIEFRPPVPDDPEEPVKPGARLFVMPARQKSEQEKALEPFLHNITKVENFVVFAHTKDGRLQVIPCLDGDLNLWDFVEAFKAASAESMRAGQDEPRSLAH